jgi:hypothetical protein
MDLLKVKYNHDPTCVDVKTEIEKNTAARKKKKRIALQELNVITIVCVNTLHTHTHTKL